MDFRLPSENAAYAKRESLFPLPFRYMHEYKQYRLQDRSTIGWCRQILNSCDGDEEAILQKFFEYYDGFKTGRNE